ncbi:unnamed protein product, partial [Rotaria sp. Silwood2]
MFDNFRCASFGIPSDGYQSARREASLSPGGDKKILDDVIFPFLRTQCAKSDKYGECVTNVGPDGAGYNVKNVGFSEDDIGHIFTDWTKNNELYNNFLLSIGGDICTRHYHNGDRSSGHVLDDVEDKVVQDADDTEDTDVWTVQEAAKAHVSVLTVTAAHLLRIASSNRLDRVKFAKLSKPRLADELKGKTHEFIEDLRGNVYVAFLASFIQGCNLIVETSHGKKWHIKMSEVIRKKYYFKLKRIVLLRTEFESHVPALSASLEYFKYVSSTDLSTAFMEAELDYFSAHAYDLKNNAKHRSRWRDLYSNEESSELTQLIHISKRYEIKFVYALSSGLHITYSSEKDLTALKRKFDQALLLISILPRQNSFQYLVFVISTTPLQEVSFSHHNINDFALEKVSELAKKHIDALNPKFRNKTLVTRDQSKKIISVVQSKLSTEK